MSLRSFARRVVSLVPFLAVSSLFVDCTSRAPEPVVPGHACTEIGCVDGLRLELAPPQGRWEKGSYSFAITTPAGTTTCQGALPLQPCGPSPSLHCEGPPITIGESGCALPPDQQGFSSIDLPAGPASVTIAIAKDGTELVKKQLSPAYRVTSPNGPECGPTCRQASDTLRW